MIKKLLMCLSCGLILLGCSNKQENSIIYNEAKLDDISYMAYYDEPVFGGRANHFVFLDSNGEIVKEEIQKMRNKSDIFSYKFEKDTGIFYMFGSGGLFQIDLNTFEADKLNDSSVHVIGFRENELIYNNGSDRTEDGVIHSNVCTLSDNGCIDLKDSIVAIDCPDQTCYISKHWSRNYSLVVWNELGIEVHQVASIVYDFTTINEQTYAVSNMGFIPVNNPSVLIPYVDEAGMEQRLTTPRVLDIINNTVYLDSQGTIYQAIINENSVSIKTQLDMENTDVMPSMLEHSVTLIQGNINTGKSIYEYNLLTGELSEPVRFNLDRFYHVVHIK